MTQEEKSLLLKDLCGRLPYDVMVDYEGNIYILNEIDPACKDIDYITVRIQDVERLRCAKSVMIENIKPYLRSMDDMTDGERHEYNTIAMHTIVTSKGFVHIEATDLIDWLNAHHFDYRALIDRGLAIAVTEDNNPYKE